MDLVKVVVQLKNDIPEMRPDEYITIVKVQRGTFLFFFLFYFFSLQFVLHFSSSLLANLKVLNPNQMQTP